MIVRKLRWEDAYIYALEEDMENSSIPMTTTLSITPLRLDINNFISIDRHWPYSNSGFWKPYIPEERKATSQLPATEEELQAECTVSFRRSKNYDGNFGFDWLRTGDTAEPGCEWYKNSMRSIQGYDNFVQEYRHFTQHWKQQYEEHKATATYLIPWVTLLPGHTARFRVKLEVNKPSGTLEFRLSGAGKDVLVLSHESIDANTAGNYYHSRELVVECKGSFSSPTELVVYVGQHLVGKMIFVPNNKTYPIKVAIVTVKTREFRKGAPKNSKDTIYCRRPDDSVLAGVTKLLRQAYIIPEFEFYELDTLEVPEGTVSSNGKTKGIYFKNYLGKEVNVQIPLDYKQNSLLEIFFKNNNYEKIQTNSKAGKKYFLGFQQFLNSRLHDKRKSFEDMFKIYFIDEDAAAGGITQGQASVKDKAAVIFKNGYNKETITHELLHCLSLPHVFADLVGTDVNKKYLFNKFSTDNIMDYQQKNDPINKRKSLWHWQIKKIWDFLK